jgi:mRNA-degrading endonuclease RelE of RelBE toxin-antitoxin system
MLKRYATYTTSGYERDVRKLIRRNPTLLERIEAMVEILKQDPYNISRQNKIKKLTDIPRGEGQWRIALGSYRIRYDIEGDDVILYSCKHRREAYR